MKPSKFAYYDPETLDEAVALKREHGSEATVLAGGLSLMPLISMRITRPKVLIDINRIAEIQDISRSNRTIEIGAGVRQHTVEFDAEIAQHLPLVTEMVAHIGHAEVRNRGTIGGSLAFADPATELPCAAITLGAELVVVGPSGTRTISAADFFVGAMVNSIADDELLTAVRFAAPTGSHGFVELSRRSGDRPLLATAAQLTFDDDGAVTAAAIGLASVADRPLRATAAEQALIGRRPTELLIDDASRTVADQVTGEDDLHATREYRCRVATTITARALRAAVRRSTEGHD